LFHQEYSIHLLVLEDETNKDTKNLKRICGLVPQMGCKIFYFFNRLVHNAPPAAAVRGLLVVSFLYHLRLQVL
jgi:hypothetical protein